jgi:coenzyme Q-binding protein COQ10
MAFYRGTQKELYAVVADVQSYPHFLPFCTSARIISSVSKPTSNPDISIKCMEAELSVGFMGFTESYTSEVTCTPYESVQVCFGFFAIIFISI